MRHRVRRWRDVTGQDTIHGDSVSTVTALEGSTWTERHTLYLSMVTGSDHSKSIRVNNYKSRHDMTCGNKIK